MFNRFVSRSSDEAVLALGTVRLTILASTTPPWRCDSPALPDTKPRGSADHRHSRRPVVAKIPPSTLTRGARLARQPGDSSCPSVVVWGPRS